MLCYVMLCYHIMRRDDSLTKHYLSPAAFREEHAVARAAARPARLGSATRKRDSENATRRRDRPVTARDHPVTASCACRDPGVTAP